MARKRSGTLAIIDVISFSVDSDTKEWLQKIGNRSKWLREQVHRARSEETPIKEVLASKHRVLQQKLEVIESELDHIIEGEFLLSEAKRRETEMKAIDEARYSEYREEKGVLIEKMITMAIEAGKTDPKNSSHLEWLKETFADEVLELKRKFRKEARDYPKELDHLCMVARIRIPKKLEDFGTVLVVGP